MNNDQWNACIDPAPMLEALRASGQASERKLRLFAIACCRRIWHCLAEPCLRIAIVTSERFADGRATTGELSAVSEAAWETKYRLEDGESDGSDRPAAEAENVAYHSAEAAAQASCDPGEDGTDYAFRAMDAARNVADAARYRITEAASIEGSASIPSQEFQAASHFKLAEQRVQAKLLRDIFPCPLRPLPGIDPAWQTWNNGTIKQLAEAAYEHRSLPSGHLDNERLAVLADALEEVGADAALVEHLRSPGPHIRGCFVIDLLTGRK